MTPIEEVTALRSQLWEAGFRPVPVINWDATERNKKTGREEPHPSAGKKPLHDKWTISARKDPPLCAEAPAVRHALNTGILADGLRPIDIDIDNSELAHACRDVALQMFGEAPMRIRQGSPRCLLLYRAAEGEPHHGGVVSRSSTKEHSCKVEVLGHGQQFVAFGRHASGAVLEWIPDPPGGEYLAALTAITEEQVHAFLVACAQIIDANPPVKPNGKDPHVAGDLQADPLSVARAMADITNSQPPDWEDHWNRGGMALHSATGGSELGWQLFLEWSKRNPAYDPVHTRQRWENYFKSPADRLGAGTLFRAARRARAGYANPFGPDDPDDPIEAREGKPDAPHPEEIFPDAPTPEPSGLPIVRVLKGLRHDAADAGIRALVEANVEFYQRAQTLVRAAVTKAKTSDKRTIEVPAIVTVTQPLLARALGKSAEWERFNAKGEAIRIDPPPEVVEQIANMFGEWPFKPLTGLISTQTMRQDGSLLVEPGYDDETGLLLLAPPPMPSIPDRPTQRDALEALAELNALLTEFPFVDQESRSVAMSMLMTPVLRGALSGAVPMHLATAPAPGTGKSYLLNIASAIATGEAAGVIAVGHNPEEFEKRLIAAVMAGDQIIALDNISDLLAGDFLAQLTSQEFLQVRPLGKSERLRIPNLASVFGNGNNLTAHADLVRRSIRCALDADLEDPETREFAGSPFRDVMADRGHYIAAILTIARAYIIAGRPKVCIPLPGFEPWSGLVRSALLWLNWADPVGSMEIQRAEDPVRLQRAAVFTAWDEEIPDRRAEGLLTSELISLAVEYTYTDGGGHHARPELHAALLAVARDRNASTISSERLGKWLRGATNTRSGDLKLEVNRQDAKRPRWQLNRVG